MLEAKQNADNCFLTLTYDNDHLPTDMSLNPKHPQDFIKRLREHFYRECGRTLRFYLVGEYGDKTERPHYHAILFGYPTCELVFTQHNEKGELSCCPRCHAVRRIWGFGNVYLGTVEESSAMYVSGYVLKKMTHRLDARLNGRYPEFGRMSLRPGVGATAMDDVASVILQHNLEDEWDERDTGTLAHAKKRLPLGRYLNRRLRERIGLDPKKPESPEYKAQIFDRVQRGIQNQTGVKETVQSDSVQPARELAARQLIYKPKRGLL